MIIQLQDSAMIKFLFFTRNITFHYLLENFHNFFFAHLLRTIQARPRQVQASSGKSGKFLVAPRQARQDQARPRQVVCVLVSFACWIHDCQFQSIWNQDVPPLSPQQPISYQLTQCMIYQTCYIAGGFQFHDFKYSRTQRLQIVVLIIQVNQDRCCVN